MEFLDRGVVAVARGDGTVLVSWRLLATDRTGLAFNVYRLEGVATSTSSSSGSGWVRLNREPLIEATCFVDSTSAGGEGPRTYRVAPVRGRRERGRGEESALGTLDPARPYLSIPLRTPEGYAPNDGSVGDLDGDGRYEILVHQVGRGRDNSQAGMTTEPILEAYGLDGTFLWRINLGPNIREGAHYTQFMVYDLDGDGRAEVACKTADGTVDGLGRILGDATADWRTKEGRAAGRILDGPEFLTVFDGLTGAELASAPYIPPRGNVGAWGDDYGNRVDRFLACVAYLDGVRPSLVMCRGYYTRSVLAAWDWREGRLRHRWTFDSDAGTEANRAYAGQGNHNLSVADVDGDGRDEIVYGAMVVDDDGRGLYSTGLGHGDALHVSDLDPGRPGLEVFGIHERPRHPNGIAMLDARTGAVLWGRECPDPGRGLAMDIDPRHAGAECWGAGPGLDSLFNARGEPIGPKPRSCNMGIWWDGDLLRELLDGVNIGKWDPEAAREVLLLRGGDHGCVSNNGTKANPVLCADILGDWREELVVRTRDNRELRVFLTPEPTEHRLTTLMHDPVYRAGIAWQNVAYNQPAHTGFHLGTGMRAPPRRAVRVQRYR